MDKKIQVPSWHRAYRSSFSQWLGRTILASAGWSLSGTLPDDKKLILAVGPHTSNWDFIYAMAAILALDIRVYWMGKHTLFRPPLTQLMKWLGGLPVDRSQPGDLAQRMAAQIQRADAMIVAITPEGTRSKVDKLKSGFVRIAQATPCGIMPVTLDFSERKIVLQPLFWPDDIDQSLNAIRKIFTTATAKNPGNV